MECHKKTAGVTNERQMHYRLIKTITIFDNAGIHAARVRLKNIQMFLHATSEDIHPILFLILID